jgi:multidrug efflux pump subunit AcrB
VIKQPGANLITMSTDMDAKLKELQKIIPQDIKITPYYEQSSFVGDAVKSVTDSLLIGLF